MSGVVVQRPEERSGLEQCESGAGYFRSTLNCGVVHGPTRLSEAESSPLTRNQLSDFECSEQVPRSSAGIQKFVVKYRRPACPVAESERGKPRPLGEQHAKAKKVHILHMQIQITEFWC